jgi:hypothetical protein
MATYSTSTLSVGSHSITAVYGGDTNFAGSTSSTLTQTVNAAPAVPEFPSLILLLPFMMATLLTAIVYKRKHPASSKR